MMIKKLCFLLTVIACGYFSQEISANEGACELITEIMEDGNYCIKHIEDDKIYLHPENISLTEEGMYLDLDGLNRVALNSIYSDKNGPFLFASHIEKMRTIYCHVCERWHEHPACKLRSSFSN